jgi:hypothetical protein
MRTTTKRRAGQLALVTVAAPVAAWALEQAARRRGGRSDLLHQPAAAPGRRLHAALWSRAAGRPAQAAAGYHRHLETAIAATRPASWLADGRGRGAGFAASAAATPRADGRAIRRTRAFGVPGSDPWR